MVMIDLCPEKQLYIIEKYELIRTTYFVKYSGYNLQLLQAGLNM